MVIMPSLWCRPFRARATAMIASALALVLAAPASHAQPASLSLADRAYAHVPQSNAFALQQFTVAAWFRATGPGENGGGTLLSAGQRSGIGTYLCAFWTGWATNGRLHGMVVHQYNVQGTVVTSQAAIPTGQIAHMAFTFDGTTLLMYVNGVLDNSVPYGFTGVDYPVTPELSIGAFLPDFGYTFNRFTGQIDDAAVWGRALSDVEVRSLYGCRPVNHIPGLVAHYPFTSSTLTDATGQGHDAAPMGAVAFGGDLVTVNPCVADVDDGSATGLCDGGVTIDDLIYYLGLFEAGDVAADVDDGSATGTTDGGVTIDDLIYYLTRFEAGC